VVPKPWNETIETHRRKVRDAILENTWALVAEHGLLSVTMSQIAKKTGIGRATLYKYFSGVEAILPAYHERQITGHLEHLAEVGDQASDVGERLEAVLEAYAFISHHREHHGTELASYCLPALAAAGSLPSEAAVRRLVKVTLDALRPRARILPWRPPESPKRARVHARDLDIVASSV
jgi:AcrR family transcriptional regulator